MCYSVLIEQDLKKLSLLLQANIDTKSFEHINELKAAYPKRYKAATFAERIYPLSFAPILIWQGEQRWLTAMRYRLRPHGSAEEVPSRYNLYNARCDSLETRPTWSRLLMRKHGILVARSFFEWITHEERKQVINFAPEPAQALFIPVLYDRWEAKDHTEGFASFALITTEPPDEVLAAGHDRCPITLNPAELTTWLTAGGSPTDRSKILKLLHTAQHPHFTWSLAQP